MALIYFLFLLIDKCNITIINNVCLIFGNYAINRLLLQLLTLLPLNIFFQYFFLVSLKYLKSYGNGLNLSIIHFWLITHVSQLCLYMHILLPLKWVLAAYMHIVYLFGIAGIQEVCVSATSLWRNTSQLKCKYSIILKNVLAVN